jgi:stage IV sporulation protein FB
MGWSFRIGRIFGIELRVHVTFLLLLAYFAFIGYARGGTQEALTTTLFILLLFLCVVLHELGHALAAARYGIKTPDITLLPIGGVARLQRMPDHPGQELVVAIAGPLVNVVIALGLYLGGLARWGGWGAIVNTDNLAADLLGSLMRINVLLVLFNMIPAFPMDGGRVLRALLAMRMNYAKATRIAATVGQTLAFGFALWGMAVGNFLLILIAIFVYFGAGQEAAAAQMRELARNVPVTEAMRTRFVTLSADDALASAVETLFGTGQHEFPVVDAAGQVVGILTRDEMIRALRTEGPLAPVSSVMRREVPMVRADASLEQALQRMNESDVPAVLVRDHAGRLVGLVTPEHVGQLMMVQSALSEAPQRPGPLRPATGPGGLASPQVP